MINPKNTEIFSESQHLWNNTSEIQGVKIVKMTNISHKPMCIYTKGSTNHKKVLHLLTKYASITVE